MIGAKKCLNACTIGRFPNVSGTEIGQIPATFAEVLVPSRPLLPVPSLLVDQDNCCQQGQPFDGEGDVRQVGYRSMAILKIERVQELLGALTTDFAQ